MKKSCVFADLGRTDQCYKDPIFCGKEFVRSLDEGKMYPGALYRFPSQAADSSKNFKS